MDAEERKRVLLVAKEEAAATFDLLGRAEVAREEAEQALVEAKQHTSDALHAALSAQLRLRKAEELQEPDD